MKSEHKVNSNIELPPPKIEINTSETNVRKPTIALPNTNKTIGLLFFNLH